MASVVDSIAARIIASESANFRRRASSAPLDLRLACLVDRWTERFWREDGDFLIAAFYPIRIPDAIGLMTNSSISIRSPFSYLNRSFV
jgi:hypothetical protein